VLKQHDFFLTLIGYWIFTDWMPMDNLFRLKKAFIYQGSKISFSALTFSPGILGRSSIFGFYPLPLGAAILATHPNFHEAIYSHVLGG
jgi:hypothetical protein